MEVKINLKTENGGEKDFNAFAQAAGEFGKAFAPGGKAAVRPDGDAGVALFAGAITLTLVFGMFFSGYGWYFFLAFVVVMILAVFTNLFAWLLKPFF